MFDNANPYTLRTEVAEGMTRYFISFMDGQAILRETEVSRPIYLEFLRFVKAERNLRRWDERHTEQSDLTDESLYDRALHKPKSVEDTAFDSLRNEKLRQAIQKLPELQRWRSSSTMNSVLLMSRLRRWRAAPRCPYSVQ